MHSPIDLSTAAVFSKPFPHFHVASAIAAPFWEQLLDWFERGAPWKLKIASFYEQYEFSLFDVGLPTKFGPFCDSDTLSYLRREVGGLFHTTLADSVDVTAHQLVPGQRIRIHNDFIPGRETHRLLLQLNRDWTEECGGMLLLFQRPEPDGVSRMIRPSNCSGLGFAISPDSHHAVSTVHKGQRFTLVYSFYERAPLETQTQQGTSAS
jgi:Rps23 Pro-64 3,4-dihydroxylase Tpa1-like proline 4-hydroxylase